MIIDHVYKRVYMAKLYWRVKVNGKWTWKPATVHDWETDLYLYGGHVVEPYSDQGEEQ